MIVKSPLKKKKTKRNVRKAPSERSNGSTKSFTNGSTNHGKRKSSSKKKSSFSGLKPWKIILGAFIVGAIGVLYLSHVFATQKLLREVNQLEREYNQAKRTNDDYRLIYDRMIGPAEIYGKAKDQGFINGGPAEKVIEVEQ
ncbi:MAG: hypothetical protein U5J95_07770 [Balneolaceae bacterium]|nr:hypothetical protein [Balneolaceae bacterium]